MRITVGTTPVPILQPNLRRSFLIWSATYDGQVMMTRSDVDSGPEDWASAAVVDFSQIGLISYDCWPGVTLWAATTEGQVELHILEGGERTRWR